MSAGVDGMTTVSPGMWASSASRLWECWLPEERPAPNWVRTVSAISAAPPVMNGQLGRLVEQLVEADAEEVEVHHLDHRAHAGHGRTHAQPDDGRLGDRGVAHPVAELVGQAPGEPEDVAAGADVDAGHEDPVVLGQLGFERGVDGVHGAEHRRIVGRRGWLRPAPAWPAATKSVKRGGRRVGQPAGGLDRLVELRRPPRTRAALISSSPTPASRSRASWTSSGSRASHSLDLLGRPVALGVALVVAVPAVGGRLDHGRARPGPGGGRPHRSMTEAVATTSLPSTAT